MVEPALTLLRDGRFAGAQNEFWNAHRYLRASEYKPAITEACKAFESAMKTICAEKGWVTNKKGEPVSKLTVLGLLNVLKDNAYFPTYQDNAMSGLVNLLSSGLAPTRNSEPAHGQGTTVVEVDKRLAHYAIQQAAANILYLASLLER